MQKRRAMVNSHVERVASPRKVRMERAAARASLEHVFGVGAVPAHLHAEAVKLRLHILEQGLERSVVAG